VDGQDDVWGRDEIDLTPGESGRVLVVRLEGLEGQMETVLGPCEPGTAGVGADSLDVGLGHAEDRRDTLERPAVFTPVDVDPQELLGAERTDDLLVELDPTIVPVGIEQADGEFAQRTSASRIAAAAAMSAVTYWSASMPRSSVGASRAAATRADRLASYLNIDRRPRRVRWTPGSPVRASWASDMRVGPTRDVSRITRA
jgi:hypothetical protein